MPKMMVSLSAKAMQQLRAHVKKHYYNRVGALSIVVETALRRYFDGVAAGTEYLPHQSPE